MAKTVRASAALSHLAANIDNPSDYSRAAKHYIPTKKAIDFVSMLAYHSQQGGGAHSLQGAYGIGKSSLGIFALNQLAAENKLFDPYRKINSALKAPKWISKIQGEGGMLAIPIIGSASPLSQRIVAGLRNTAANHIGRKPRLLKKADQLNLRETSGDLLQEQLVDLLDDKNVNRAGVLMIIDEFGRQFEHILATGQLDDLHLLQNLAELPGKGKVPFNIVIVQHHGLEHYTSRFMSKQYAEWEKVRGRFHEFLLNNTETDTANIVSALTKPFLGKTTSKVAASKKKYRLGKTVVPLHEDFLAAAKKSLPLHPMTIFLLSRLARLMGQSDRTIVGWLSSHLDTGFQAALKKSNSLVYPEALFRHFFGDIQNMPTNPIIAKRFNAVHSAYNRHGAEDQELETRLLKTIGLLYFCQGSGLNTNFETIKYSLPETRGLRKAINSLESKSLITYRGYSNEYRVWEGSDYDIQTKLSELVQGSEFSPASTISGFAPKRILAHKHLIETGNHRTAEVVWLDRKSPEPVAAEKFVPQILIWLDKPPKNKKDLSKECVWGVMDTKGISDQLQEMDALQQLVANDQELKQDKVASSEVEERLAYMKTVIVNKVNAALNTQIKWHLNRKAYLNLQQATSKMMAQLYEKSFVLHNEMINREKTSGQASLAVRLLIEAMVQKNHEKEFGIEKFPPQRLLYECFFHSTKIHRMDGKSNWNLSIENLDSSGLGNAFKLIASMGKASSSTSPCKINSIVSALAEPPYGAKPLPVLLLCCIYIFVKRDQVELYEDGSFQPTWSYQTLTRLVKSPSSFSINMPESASYSAKLLADYRQVLSKDTKKVGKNTPLNIARDILLRYSALTTYAKNTAYVSEKAAGIRRSIMNARSPDSLIFEAFPKIFGLRSFPKQKKKQQEFFAKLEEALAELDNANENLLQYFEKILFEESALRQLESAQKKLAEKAQLISTASRMNFSNDAFLKNIIEDSFGDPTIWFRNLLEKGLGIYTPLDSWSNDEVAQAELTFRTNLMWLQQASATLSAQSKRNGNGARADKVGPEASLASNKKLAAVDKQLSKLPQEQVVPVLLELLRRHSGLS